ncbi:MAG: protein kinase domain-containing protein [Candidatus Acidiferrum sp.]
MQKLGKYEIVAELGHGAMGVVYKARDPLIGRLVALKTINTNLVDRPDLLERFYQEAQSAGKLQHPNIVTVFELGQEKDTPFIAMEFVDGESLEKIIVEQIDLPLALKVGYIVRVCQALEFAHKNRVVHRDIKPGNIMVTSEGVVKVVDFGIARLVDFSRTHTNMMIGTPAYMAPELFRKKKADERTDIWAVGVTFYELLCYQRPFTGDGYDIIRSIAEDEFPVASSIASECTPELDAIIGRMLRKPAAERYQSMEDVLLELEPVWTRMRAEASSALAERARGLYERGNLPRAQDTLRRARLIDSSNVQAKSLLEKISAELRRTEIQPKVQEHLGRGRELLRSGKLREAQAEAEAALNLDSRCEPAQELVSEVEAGVAREKKLENRMRLARQRLAAGAIAEAQTALRQALELDAHHPEALELSRQLGEEKGRREKRQQLSNLISRARGLWTELKYEECLALLAEGLKDFPNEPELISLQQSALQDQLEQSKQRITGEAREREIQRRVQEIQSKIKRQELTGAIDLARQSLDTMGPDTDVTRLLQAAEGESAERKKKREAGNQQLEAAQTLLEKEDFTGAKQVLDRAIATRILQPADLQTRQMLSRIAEKEAARQAKEQADKKKETQKQTLPGATTPVSPDSERRSGAVDSRASLGPGAVARASAPPAPTRTIMEPATSFASARPRQEASVPVMTPPPAQPQPVPMIQTQVRIEERPPQIAAAPPAKGSSGKLAVLLLVVLGLVVAGGAVYLVMRLLPKAPAKPSAEDVALEAEAKQLWDNHKLDDSLADWKKLGSHPGPLHDEALKRASDLDQQDAAAEQKYAEGMRLLYEEKKFPEAAVKFNEVIQMNSWKLDEARHEFEIASKGPGETPAEPLWQALFDEGKQAFDKKDYPGALQDFQQVTQTNGVPKGMNALAEGLIVVLRDREEQKKTFDQAIRMNKSGQKQQAKDAFGRVVRAPNGDLDLVASAKNQIDQIGAIPEPPPNSGSNGNANSAKGTPDYAAAIGEVRNLIGQGRWDDAASKLNSLPPTQPEYNGLKSQLETGRREDEYYGRMKTAFSGAQANKNADALLTLRPYFATEAAKADRHSEDARGVITQIDADLREVAANGKLPGGGSGPGEKTKGNDPAEIADVLKRYAAAYDAGDLQAITAVRQFNAKEQDKLQNILAGAKGKGYALQNCSRPQVGRVTATVSCTGVFTKATDIQPQRVNFVLRRVSGQWTIVSSN